MIGQTVSHYKILEKLGGRGMGVVYKAEDTKLKRTVALKFLPADLTRDEEAKERFVHEAQAASALDHTNVCTTYEIDETEDGQIFICMAFYEGETLKREIERGPLRIDHAIDISLQIAQGLAKAHERGITHRDVKPANIMVTKAGVVKILDFGLAKLAGQTMVTKRGTTMGTVAYMSPEQARGETVDHRTDIWSLGVVLYEMITGQRPFKGDYENAVTYSILNVSPDPITGLRSSVPLEFERVVNKCLEKDPADRYQGVTEVVVDLRRLKRDVTSTRLATPVFHPSSGAFLRSLSTMKRLIVAVSFTAIVIAGIYYFVSNEQSAELIDSQLRKQGSGNSLVPPRSNQFSNHELKLVQFTSAMALADFPSWSPDGSWIAYASNESGSMDIWKKPVEGGPATQLTRSPYHETQPAWSPDGRKIAYSSNEEGGGIFLIPSDGGPSWHLSPLGANPTWSPDGKSLAFDWHGNILTIPAKGGVPRALVVGTSATPHVAWSPDGNRLAFWYRTKGDIYTVSVNGGAELPLGLVPSGAEVSGITWSKDGGHLVFSRGAFGGSKNLWMVMIDSNSGKPLGAPVVLSVTTTYDVHCSFSPDASKIAFTARQIDRQLYSLRLDPSSGLASGKEQQITSRTSLNYYPALSPNDQNLVWTSHEFDRGHLHFKDLKSGRETKVTQGWARLTREIGGVFSPDDKQISYSSTLGGSYQIWRIPILGGASLPLTDTQHPTRDVFPVWSPDGKTILFVSNRSGNWDIWHTQANGRGEPQQLTDWPSNELNATWSPDGDQVAFVSDSLGHPDIWLVDSDGRNPHSRVVGPSEEAWPTWSPDGRWIYSTSDRTGAFNVWVMPAKGGGKRQVTHYQDFDFGLPEQALFTKFAVSSTRLILPLEERKGEIYILENVKLENQVAHESRN